VFVAKKLSRWARFAGGKVWKEAIFILVITMYCAFNVFSGKAENYGARNLSMGMAREERVAVRAG
jgi:hypothetical protein